ncbi:hypothetical protein ACQ4LE_009089 [Meloidogyne hapla]
MKKNLVICCAIALSGTTIIICIAGIICMKIQLQLMWDELDFEIKQFNIKTDNLWEGMLRMGAGTPSNRKRRENYGGYGILQQVHSNLFTAKVATGPLKVALGSLCSCIPQNDCPTGPPGVQGNSGQPGERGIGGLPGIPGHDALDVQSLAFKGCFNCPAGPQGTPGKEGNPGIRGPRGSNGIPGISGRDGVPGLTGEVGPMGVPGEIGKPGKAGDIGKDAEKLIGRKGVRGPQGQEGPQGQMGEKGLDGVQGRQGVKGPPGTPGSQGPPGPDGEEGGRGLLGKHGQDAEYCPCPARDGKFGKRSL